MIKLGECSRLVHFDFSGIGGSGGTSSEEDSRHRSGRADWVGVDDGTALALRK